MPSSKPSIPARVILILIRGYQYLLSPLLGQNCRFYPSCSTYFYQSILEHGLLKGFWLGLKRIVKCHPCHAGGYDPVPQAEHHTHHR